MAQKTTVTVGPSELVVTRNDTDEDDLFFMSFRIQRPKNLTATSTNPGRAATNAAAGPGAGPLGRDFKVYKTDNLEVEHSSDDSIIVRFAGGHSVEFDMSEDKINALVRELDAIAQKTIERTATGTVAIGKNLPPGFGREIGKYIGGRKTRKQHRRRHR